MVAWEGPRGCHLFLALLPTVLVVSALLLILVRPNSSSSGPRLAWADEFNAPALDSSKWSFLYGDGSVYGLQGWGQQEVQCYVNTSDVIGIIPDPDSFGNSLLAITAVYNQGRSCYNGQSVPSSTRDWTSARITTWGKQSFAPSPSSGLKVEARVKVPMVQGSFPAFWMLPDPDTTPYGNWCASGEIDIMEHVNLEQEVHGTIHFGGGNGASSATNCQRREGVTNIPNNGDWHTHAVVWTSSYIAWMVDDTEYYRADSNQWWSGNARGVPGAPFNAPFYLLLNLAVGGVWAGPPASTASFQYLVDYVRVWEVPATPQLSSQASKLRKRMMLGEAKG